MLEGYLARMVVRHDVARELAQETWARALAASSAAPAEERHLRRWLFRIATNLAVDERRRHGSWRESLMEDTKQAALASPDLPSTLDALSGTPEGHSIAKEHLSICFACVLGQLPSQHAAALLLREIYDFELQGIADMLDADRVQVKNWIQKARNKMRKRYAQTCSLIAKQGVCYQCVQLDERVNNTAHNPLGGGGETFRRRLQIVRDRRAGAGGPWSDYVSRLFADM